MRSINFKSLGSWALLPLALATSSASATVLTFDDLPPLTQAAGAYYAAIPNGYGGLNWNNFNYLNVGYENALYGVNSETADLMSGTNIAFNSYGLNASAMAITSPSLFNMSSGYFTGIWNDNLSITADAYVNGSLVSSQTFLVNTASPTLENLNFNDVDEVTFGSSGGTPHGFASGGSGVQFALDNLSVSTGVTVPEPTGIALLGVATFGLLRRNRDQ